MGMAPSYRRRQAAGFTLTEVLIAMTILLMVFLSSLAALNIGFKMLDEARASTLASQILQSEIENLRLRNWPDIVSLPETEPFVVEVDPALTNFPTFTCQRSIYAVRDGLKQAVVTVAWKSLSGQSRTRRYTTYIARDGMYDYYYCKFP